MTHRTMSERSTSELHLAPEPEAKHVKTILNKQYIHQYKLQHN